MTETTGATGASQYTNPCACGWEVTGPMDDVVDATIDHGRRIHNMEATREEVVAVLMSGASPDEPADLSA